MRASRPDDSVHPLPPGLAKPALRALAAAGYNCLDDLTEATEAEISSLHGMGPTAIDRLRRALAEHGLTFTN
jgi:hypothetical protein